MLYINPGVTIEFDYVNWKGASSHRRVIINKVLYGNNRYHPQPQWLMEAQDIDRNEVREFAMRDMTNVIRHAEPYNPHSPVVETIKRKS